MALLESDDLPPNVVLLNVYDITWANTVLGPVGIGVYHSGIEVYGAEYAFGRAPSSTGVFAVRPKTCPVHTFRESLVLGTTRLSHGEVAAVVRRLSAAWSGPSYHITQRNCNVFAGVLAAELLAAPSVPGASTTPEAGGGGAASQHADAYDYEGGAPGAFPAWVNRLANTGERIAPGLCAKIDGLDRKMQGM